MLTASRAAPRAGQLHRRVLLVDDEASVRDAVGRFLRSRGFEVHVADTVASGLERVKTTRFAAIVCDVRMPGASGMDLIPEARRLDDDLAIVMLTGLNDASAATEALTLGASDYLLKPVELDRLETAIGHALRRRDERISRRAVEQRVRDDVVQLAADAEREKRASSEHVAGVLAAVVAAFEARDPHRCGHSQRVQNLASDIAKRLGLDTGTIQQVRTAAGVHEVGMVGVPDSLLLKPGPLTDTEFVRVRLHVENGVNILAPVASLAPTLRIVREHHERWDGTGYPDRLAGDAICLGARIVAVADAYVAVTAGRAYFTALAPPNAVEHLAPHAGTQFDPDVFRVLEQLAHTHRGGAGSHPPDSNVSN